MLLTTRNFAIAEYRASVAQSYVEGISSNSVTLKSSLGVTQSHWKWHRLIDRTQVRISAPRHCLV